MTNFLLFALFNSEILVGLPPSNPSDNFHARSMKLGRMDSARLVAYSPDGLLYVVRGADLYRGPVPASFKQNWFDEAQQVGQNDWDQFKSIFFRPNGHLYAVTLFGKFYEGPPPTNKLETWKAKKIGAVAWQTFSALFFDGNGILYAADESNLLKQEPPTSADEPWTQTSTIIGSGNWSSLSHLMAFDPNGNLWCVSKVGGRMYMGRRPPMMTNVNNWTQKVKSLGVDYNNYGSLMFIQDRTIQSITSLEFLAGRGRVLSASNEVVAERVYNNKGSSIDLETTYVVKKTYEVTSSFSLDDNFIFDAGGVAVVKGAVPVITSRSKAFEIDRSTTYTWDLTKTNTHKVELCKPFPSRVPPRKAVKETFVVQKAVVEVPYHANVTTHFNFTTTISGVWKGVSYFDLHVERVDV
ncbi:tachylectin-2-like [Hyperolius riggenbachi]|uniref:tachylectin-2-like n=1 Tax=Hyperolius riggenbachi TaxID=752182 RepID=UPI0035A3688A